MRSRSLLPFLLVSLGAPFALARPVQEKTPLHASAADTRVSVLGISLGRFRSPDLRRIESQLSGIMTEELEEAGYAASEYEGTPSKSDEEAEPPFAIVGEVRRFACEEQGNKSCGIVIEWALLDFESGAVIYRVKTSHEETELSEVGKGEAARAIVRGAFRSLLSRPKLARALTQPGDVFEERLPDATIRACGSEKLEMPKDAEEVLGATVVVRTSDGVGSAVSVSPDGYLLTAAHVVAGHEKKTVTLIPRGGKELRARVVRYDEGSDVALLKVEAGPAVAACLALSQTAAKAGEDVYVVGAPAGEELSFSMSRGILSGKRRLHGNDYLQTDASINPGNSGGPLLNGTAGVLGIVSWKMSGTALEGLGFAVEIDSALEALALSTGTETSSELKSERARTNVFKKPVVDRADGPWELVGHDSRSSSSSSGEGGSEAVGILRGAGLLAMVLGGSTVGLSALANNGNTTDAGAYYRARTYNDVGWIVLGVGTAAVATSFIIPLFGKGGSGQAKSSGWRGAGLRAGVGAGGLQLGLEVRH